MRIWILLTVLLASPAAAQLDVERVTELEAQIAERTADSAPGVAIGIVRDGEIIYEHYAGLANLEHNVPVGPQLAFIRTPANRDWVPKSSTWMGPIPVPAVGIILCWAERLPRTVRFCGVRTSSRV